MTDHAKQQFNIGWTMAALLALSVTLVGCGDKSTPAPQADRPEKVEQASTPAQVPPPAAEGAEMLTPTEMRAVQKIYQAQARQTINAQNAEAITNALAKEIEADIASQKDPATKAP